jgi:hypothetical protein
MGTALKVGRVSPDAYFACEEALESLREYLFVKQDSPQVNLYTKSAPGEWIYHVSIGLEAKVILHSLDIEIAL